MTFEAGPANPAPFRLGLHTQPAYEIAEALPQRAAGRLLQLRERAEDLHAMCIPFAEIQEESTARVQAEQRLKRLQDHQQHGGFGLAATTPA